MPTSRNGSVHLFQFKGINVYLHWSWFLFAAFEINGRNRAYTSVVWNIIEYLALFLIVLLHEFGHALACRQVGGRANQIVLWPLGGVAYVDPPPRPGATLWSIAAGPLVNVALFPIFWVMFLIARSQGWAETSPDIYRLLYAVLWIDGGLLLFNILPIYPLDGGQILRALLWFPLGRARSLLVATVLGFVGVAAFIGLAIYVRSTWFAILAVFMLMNCWGGLRYALALTKFAKLPRRPEFSCPSCKASPPIGDFWRCANCSRPFDAFQNGGVCPYCSSRFSTTPCIDCGQSNAIQEWSVPVVSVSSTFSNPVGR